MKLVISGSRNTPQPEAVQQVKAALAAFTSAFGEPTAIITGCARGIDQAAYSYCRNKGMHVTKHFAEWDRLGNAAGPIRNAIMAKEGDALVAIWDGQSKGTKNMISQMAKVGKPGIIVHPKNPGIIESGINLPPSKLCTIKGWKVGTVLENQDGNLLIIDDFAGDDVIGRRCNVWNSAWCSPCLLLLRGNETTVACLPEDLRE